jgi:DNA polymerase delta subunit 1
MDVFPVDWLARDRDDAYVITLFGKDMGGKLVASHIQFYPYFYVKLPASYGSGQTKLFIADACSKYGAITRYCRVVERMSLWGFTNGAKAQLVQLAFPTLRKMKWAARKLHDMRVTTYESSMDPMLRFFHIRNVVPAQWVHIKSFSVVADAVTRADAEVHTTFDKVFPSTLTDRPPLILCSWDIETYSKTRKFPLAENEDDHVIQIASTFQRYGEPKPYRTSVMALGDTESVPGVDVVSFDDEADLINAWCDEVAAENVDILLGYNTHQYDWKYLYGRSLVCVDDASGESCVDFSKLGRMIDGGGDLRERELNSGAFGQNKFTSLATPGVLQIDLLQYVRRETKLDSYSLNNVSKHFLGDCKVDLPAHEIFECFEGTPADRARIAEYAAKDTALPLQLMSKLCVFENLGEMANATFCPVDYVLNRGQQIKVYSVLMKKARAMGYACPDGVGIGVVGKFTGATVLNAERGAYFDIVSGLDFASLYPSIIRAWSLDFSTIVLDPKYDNLPGVEYYEVETDQGTFRFAQGFKGVLPSLLEDLAVFRKNSKKKMADAKARNDSFAASLHNAAQLAFKVTMNR